MSGNTSVSFKRLNARLLQVPEAGIILPLREPTSAKHLRFLLVSGAEFCHVRLGTDALTKADIQALALAKASITVDTLDTASDYNVNLTPLGGSVQNFAYDAVGDGDTDDTRDGIIALILATPGVGGFAAEDNGTGTVEIWRTNGELFTIAVSITGGTGTISEASPHPAQGGDDVLIADVILEGNLYSSDEADPITHIGLKPNSGESCVVLFWDITKARIPFNAPTS